MTAPDPTTTSLYEGLPGFVQASDEDQPGHPLLAYLSAIGGALEVVAAIIRRLTPREDDPSVAGPSELADPQAADPAWLPWLAQGSGTQLTGLAVEQARRDAITYAPAGWRRGTNAAIAGAARTALTGSKYVRVYEHSVTSPGDGEWYDLLLVTRLSETPDVPAVLTAVTAQRAKPAGAVLHHLAYTATLEQTRAALGVDTLAARQAMFPRLSDASDYLP